jgi:hypothetical protein
VTLEDTRVSSAGNSLYFSLGGMKKFGVFVFTLLGLTVLLVSFVLLLCIFLWNKRITNSLPASQSKAISLN